MNIAYYFEATHLQLPKSLPRSIFSPTTNGSQNHPNTCPTPSPFFAHINPLCLQTVSPYAETTPALKPTVHPINGLSPYNIYIQCGRIVNYTTPSYACPMLAQIHPTFIQNQPQILLKLPFSLKSNLALHHIHSDDLRCVMVIGLGGVHRCWCWCNHVSMAYKDQFLK